ncbi:MAG: AbrB/MazE/SpoVT family DNA-binding domain-containing protein [Acetobacteraceae bacterium]
MPTATVTSKGQITIPQQVRHDMGVTAGDRIDFVRMEDGNYAVVPASHSVRSLKGVIPRRGKPASLRDMQAAIEAAATGQ